MLKHGKPKKRGVSIAKQKEIDAAEKKRRDADPRVKNVYIMPPVDDWKPGGSNKVFGR